VTWCPRKFAGFPLGTRGPIPTGGSTTVLKTFGQPAANGCECEREGDSNLAPALQLINGRLSTTGSAIPPTASANSWPRTGRPRHLGELFLATLSRGPGEAEASANADHVARAMDKTQSLGDVHWALINSKGVFDSDIKQARVAPRSFHQRHPSSSKDRLWPDRGRSKLMRTYPRRGPWGPSTSAANHANRPAWLLVAPWVMDPHAVTCRPMTHGASSNHAGRLAVGCSRRGHGPHGPTARYVPH